MTLRDLVRSSFRCIGVLHEGQGPNGDDITDGLVVLNAMLSGWSLDRLNVFTIERDQYNLVAHQQAYTIGVGGQLNAARPIKIDRAAVIYSAAGTYAPEIPLGNFTLRGWENLAIKNIPSTIPTNYYYDNAYPLATLNVWPVPTIVLPLVLYVWQAITTGLLAANLDVALSFPPGYEDAIRYNLAVRLAPEWDRPLRDDVDRLAKESKLLIQSINAPAPVMKCDAAMLRGGGGAYWSYLTGNYEQR